MLRALTSLLWFISALALGFEAVAQPCDLRGDMMEMSHAQMSSDMPCHEGMTMAAETEPEQPQHEQSPSCCCAALLGNGVMVEPLELARPALGITLWAAPLPQSGSSIFVEYEPPPPRV